MALRDLYRENDQPLKAVEAQVSAAEHHSNRVEKIKLLFDAARSISTSSTARIAGSTLLEKVVELDPDHREATGILLERLVAAGDLRARVAAGPDLRDAGARAGPRTTTR